VTLHRYRTSAARLRARPAFGDKHGSDWPLAWIHPRAHSRDSSCRFQLSLCTRATRLQVRGEPTHAAAVLAGERRASEPVAPQQVFDLQDERDSHEIGRGARSHSIPLLNSIENRH
jgi:hypothetical protein